MREFNNFKLFEHSRKFRSQSYAPASDAFQTNSSFCSSSSVHEAFTWEISICCGS